MRGLYARGANALSSTPISEHFLKPKRRTEISNIDENKYPEAAFYMGGHFVCQQEVVQVSAMVVRACVALAATHLRKNKPKEGREQSQLEVKRLEVDGGWFFWLGS